jgi:hypothetical protein
MAAKGKYQGLQAVGSRKSSTATCCFVEPCVRERAAKLALSIAILKKDWPETPRAGYFDSGEGATCCRQLHWLACGQAFEEFFNGMAPMCFRQFYAHRNRIEQEDCDPDHDSEDKFIVPTLVPLHTRNLSPNYSVLLEISHCCEGYWSQNHNCIPCRASSPQPCCPPQP